MCTHDLENSEGRKPTALKLGVVCTGWRELMLQSNRLWAFIEVDIEVGLLFNFPEHKEQENEASRIMSSVQICVDR